MPSKIKAIVFKTPELKATKFFFENILDFKIKETSARHFVISSKGIRLAFIESRDNLEIELYTQSELAKEIQKDLNQAAFKTSVDPNGIKIIRVFNHQKNNF